jgi:hypothetical protein
MMIERDATVRRVALSDGRMNETFVVLLVELNGRLSVVEHARKRNERRRQSHE